MEQLDIVVLGGGNAAGYFCRAAVEHGFAPRVTVIGAENVVSYERPALSKAYLAPATPARLPGFHTCVGGGGERQEPAWYKGKGIDFRTGTRVTAVDVAGRTLTLAGGARAAFKTLVIATGARAVTLADFGAPGADLPGVHTLRNVADADALLADLGAALKAANGTGADVVVVGGGYIGAEVAAGVSQHAGARVTVVLPEASLLARVMPADLAAFYERFYAAKGIRLVKGATVAGFAAGPDGRVAQATLKGDAAPLPAALAVVGVGARPEAELFDGQLRREAPGRGGLVVDGLFRCHGAADGAVLDGVYAIGDVAAFELLSAPGGGADGGPAAPQRQEHVTHARQSAAHAAAAIAGAATGPYDYAPFFYSRVFGLSWVFHGYAPAGAAVVPFGLDAALPAADRGEAPGAPFGAYWLGADGHVAGVFLESGSPDQAAAAAKVARARPAATAAELASAGAGYLTAAAARL